jgi:hypothetical protein
MHTTICIRKSATAELVCIYQIPNHSRPMHRAQAAVKGSSAWLDSQLRVRKRLELLGDTVRRDLPKVNGCPEAGWVDAIACNHSPC